ncbi:hypothetical protein V8C37DRAFT_368430 [Trichoderma ceciliae]
MPLPWWSRKRDNDLPSYESLKQDEGADSEAVREVSISNRKATPQKRLIASIIFNLSLVILVVAMYSAQWPKWKPKRMVPSPIPDFPHEVRTFRLDPLFMSRPSVESDGAWESLSGPNRRAFVHIQEPEKYDYPDSVGGLSMFHQLHCLASLRGFVWKLVHGEVDTEQMLKEWPANISDPTYRVATQGLWHIAHCFDYLRQAIQCNGDTALEFVPETSPMAVINGLDWPHECKSWDAIWEYAERNG